MTSVDPCDPNFRRLRYCRYADDFLLGFDGPKAEAEEIKAELRTFLNQRLRLELSEEKTLLTHARTGKALFLGYEVNVMWSRTRIRNGQRSVAGTVGLHIPPAFIEGKCRRFTRNGKTVHRPAIEKDRDFDIITCYQQEYRGYVEYYAISGNLSWMNRLHWVMRDSLIKTLAYKHRTTRRRIVRKYSTTVVTPAGPRKCLQMVIPREGRPPLVSRFGGISLRKRRDAVIKEPNGFGPHTWIGTTELVQRLLADECEVCGSSENVEVHHVRKLSNLKMEGRKEKPLHVRIMSARRRKTLVLCRRCHRDLHAGKPLTRKSNSE